MKIFSTCFCLAAGLVQFAWGQGNPVPLATTGLVSPELHADRTVTFRIQAPDAKKVELAGEWISANRAETTTEGSGMKKDDKGVWTATVGPLEPNTYTYSFNVDGMNIADPVNPIIKLRARTSASLVTIPGNQPWEYRDVPHGTVEVSYHRSAVLSNEVRELFGLHAAGIRKECVIEVSGVVSTARQRRHGIGLDERGLCELRRGQSDRRQEGGTHDHRDALGARASGRREDRR
jgi:hypothetical protein